MAALFCFLMALGGIFFYTGQTEVSPWLAPAIGAATGLATLPAGLKSWIKFPFVPGKIFAGIYHVAATGIAVTFLLLAANYHFASKSSAEHVAGVVRGKQIEHKTRYRRVGRGRMIPSGTYPVYTLSIEMNDGEHRKESVSNRRYNSIRRGDTLVYTVERGLLGWRIISDNGLYSR